MSKISPCRNVSGNAALHAGYGHLFLHHETLERALGYLSGVEDVTNTCDDAEIYKCSDGIFTLTLRTTDCKWASPMIFYVAETYDNDTQRFEIAVSSDGQRRPTDLLGID